MADDLGGHALAHLALGLGIDRQREVGVGLDVDEARRHRQAGRVDHFRRIVAEIGADGGDAAVADREVAGRPAAPVPSSSNPPRIRMSCAMELRRIKRRRRGQPGWCPGSTFEPFRRTCGANGGTK